MKALVLDDDPMVRSYLTLLLTRRGHEVTSFPDPACCSLCTHASCSSPDGGPCIDIIISDVKMPQITGLDFVESLLRKGCKCRHIALISGAWSEADMKRALQFPAKIFAKPCSATDISRWIETVENDPAVPATRPVVGHRN